MFIFLMFYIVGNTKLLRVSKNAVDYIRNVLKTGIFYLTDGMAPYIPSGLCEYFISS